MDGKYMQFYKDAMESGLLRDFGLCHSLGGALLEMFEPTKEDEDQLISEGLSILYWASGVSAHWQDDKEKHFGFTPLRQTIVLFMAAINNEL